ncbi:MAG TPA: NAD(P)/FAD-dependent oxidoreductase [Gemmatimonadaceae bacterium]|nr:NAD(P)/FAD-dependent oxidoreductase [Gemmatimonadaceae bacterium]
MAAYDLVTVGGGVGGSVLGRAMAGHGYRVLIVEREPQFRDRVRGEFIFPWGVREAQELGVYDALLNAGAHHPACWTDYFGPDPLPSRDLAETTPQGLHGLCIYHPRMQDALLQAAEAAGAEVRRATRVREIEPGEECTVRLEENGRQDTVAARLVVGADGRSSMVRKWGGFPSRQDPSGNVLAGVLLEGVPASPESSICMITPPLSRMVLYFPQSSGSGRAYLAFRSGEELRLSGDSAFDAFLQECARSGLADGLFDGAKQAGPLAAFAGNDSWVEHPYRRGIALIGDAAATSDQTWGQGLSLTLRDARVLRDALLSSDDRDVAGHRYAASHNEYFDTVRTAESWFTQVFLTPGPEADAIRSRVMPQMESDPFILPDTLFSGPELAPPTEEHRAKIFGQPI